MIEDIHAVRGSEFDTFGIEWTLISPRTWQEDLILPKKRLPRKRALKKLAQRLVDTTDKKFNVTLYIADAILIAKFFKDKGGKNGT